MNLEEQIQLLIAEAPQDGITPSLVAAIAPGLKSLAGQLRHSQYFIVQNLENNWVLTTLSYDSDPSIEKCVIYAFPTIKDASALDENLDPQLMAIPIPTTHILFQLMALETVDSIIFLETPGDLTTGVEVRREDLQHLIQTQLKQNQSVQGTPQPLPPDIA